MNPLRDHFDSQLDAMATLLEHIVRLESPTTDKAAVDRLGAFLAEQVRDLGAEVPLDAQTDAGDHVVARWGHGDGQVLIMCHMDTVWDIGALPLRREDSRLFGPGAYDMKGGIVIALSALRGLRALQLWPDLPITLLFTSDEERGSRTSRELIEAEARRSRLVLCMEPALANGALKTRRKGTGLYKITTYGRASHAGADHEKGINAIEELAHHVIALQRLTDYSAGTTLSVGRIEGGTRSNVVPDRAWAWVDVRVTHHAESERLAQAIMALQPALLGARVEVSGGISRQPMERTPRMAQTFAWAQAVASELGMTLLEGASGGGSDANFTAALGVPTLDGLGVVGDGAHSIHEHALLTSLPERAALLAALLRAAPALDVS
jgi:glutamate carboxypeptidase